MIVSEGCDERRRTIGSGLDLVAVALVVITIGSGLDIDVNNGLHIASK